MDFGKIIGESVTGLKESIDDRRKSGQPVDEAFLNALLNTADGEKLSKAAMKLEENLIRNYLRDGYAQTEMITGKNIYDRLLALLKKPDLDPARAYQWLAVGIINGARDAMRSVSRHKSDHSLAYDNPGKMMPYADIVHTGHSGHVTNPMLDEAVHAELRDNSTLENVLIAVAKEMPTERRQMMKLWLKALKDRNNDALYVSISKAAQIPEGTVKSRLSKIRRNIMVAIHDKLQSEDMLSDKEEKHDMAELIQAKGSMFNLDHVLNEIEAMGEATFQERIRNAPAIGKAVA